MITTAALGHGDRSRTNAGAAVRGVGRWASPAIATVVLAVVAWRLGTGPFLAGLRGSTAELFWRSPSSCSSRPSALRGGGRSSPAALAFDFPCPPPLRVITGRFSSTSRFLAALPGTCTRRQSWPRGAQRRPRAEGCGLGARRGPGRTGGMTISVLLMLPSPLRSHMPFVAGAAVGIAIGSSAGCEWEVERSPVTRVRNAVVTDIRDGVLRRNAATGGRALVGRGGLWTHGNVPYRRTHGGRNRADLPAPTAGHAFIARHGLAERRRLGAA